jgi:hypothetical protein
LESLTKLEEKTMKKTVKLADLPAFSVKQYSGWRYGDRVFYVEVSTPNPLDKTCHYYHAKYVDLDAHGCPDWDTDDWDTTFSSNIEEAQKELQRSLDAYLRLLKKRKEPFVPKTFEPGPAALRVSPDTTDPENHTKVSVVSVVDGHVTETPAEGHEAWFRLRFPKKTGLWVRRKKFTNDDYLRVVYDGKNRYAEAVHDKLKKSHLGDEVLDDGLTLYEGDREVLRKLVEEFLSPETKKKEVTELLGEGEWSEVSFHQEKVVVRVMVDKMTGRRVHLVEHNRKMRVE